MFNLPPQIKWIEKTADGRVWLRELPARIVACVDRWSVQLGNAYEQSYVSVVFPATMPNGTSAVLKIQFRHRESEYEAEALRRWDGHGAVQLIDHDPQNLALLIERCEPGDHLSTVNSEEALGVFADLLPRLWVPASAPFISLCDEAAVWAAELPLSWERAGRPFERELLDAALEVLDVLPRSQGRQVLIHQDLHADNVLRAVREPWLVIDPKPVAGEREFSISPIVRSYEFGHSRKHVVDRLDRLVSALDLDYERARLWSFAQTLAWAFEGDRVLTRHVQTARWLWQRKG